MKLPDRRDGTYYLEGQQFVSVTEVLTALAKPALVPWAAKQAARAVFSDPERYDTAEKAVAAVTQIKTDAADRGKNMHSLIEEWAKSGKLPVPPEDDPYVRGFLSFARAWNPKPLYIECTVFNKTHMYAGRLDMIAEIAGEIWIVDFKTGKGIWPEYGLQLTAYKNAEFFKMKDEPTIHTMPKVDQTGIVSIPGNGLFDFKLTNEPLEVFLALKRVHAWMKPNAA